MTPEPIPLRRVTEEPPGEDRGGASPPPGGGGDLRDKLHNALEFAILAPSSHNSQPWLFDLADHSVLLRADRARSLPVVDPQGRELVMSCGAALFNLRVALARFGCGCEVEAFPDPADRDVIASVRVIDGRAPEPGLAEMFAAIPRRTTNRSAFEDTPVPPELREKLRLAAEAEGAHFTCVWADNLRASVAKLVAEADVEQFGNHAFRKELSHWLHRPGRGDGIPLHAEGVSELLDFATPVWSTLVRTFDVGSGAAATHTRLAQASPLLALISTERDDREAWLAAGQALERVLLIAADDFFDASFMNQPIECASKRPKVRGLMGGAAHPQLLMRMGRGRAPRRAPRRALREVLRQPDA